MTLVSNRVPFVRFVTNLLSFCFSLCKGGLFAFPLWGSFPEVELS